jgi:hypothetical protein
MLSYPVQSFDNRVGTMDTTGPREATMENPYLLWIGFLRAGERRGILRLLAKCKPINCLG